MPQASSIPAGFHSAMAYLIFDGTAGRRLHSIAKLRVRPAAFESHRRPVDALYRHEVIFPP
jgi:hypothetical protein